MKAKMLAVLFLAAIFVTSAPGSVTVQVEKNHSSIWFQVPIAAGMTKVSGSFTDFSASITVDEEDMTKSSVMVTIAVSSINTGNDDRDKDLQGNSFFDAENNPEIKFESKEVRKSEDGFIAIGDLTMRGITKSIELSFVLNGVKRSDDGRPYFGFSAHTTLNRQDFKVGSEWKHSLIDNFIGDDIEVQIDLWTKKPKKEEK